MKVAVVGVPGGWSTERLAGALAARGARVEVVGAAAAAVRLPDPRLWHRGRAIEGLAGVVVKKLGDTADGWVVRERLDLLRHLEASGVPVLSAPDRLELALSRARLTQELAREAFPIPDTVITEDPEEAEGTVARFGRAVLKPLYTSKGRGMDVLDAGPAVRPALDRHRRAGRGPFYLQRFVPHPGRDLAVAVLDGRCVGAYWRVAAAGQWMTTILSGGRYERADPPAGAVDLALRAARHFGLVFTGVDLVEAPGGDYQVLEVSAFGGFRGLDVACKVDAAAQLAGVVLARLEAADR
jgi:ribosomal protein S6--L-glutamate ligase